jgi:hypothetical protein
VISTGLAEKASPWLKFRSSSWVTQEDRSKTRRRRWSRFFIDFEGDS